MFQLPGHVLRGALLASSALVLLSTPALAKTPRVHAITGARIVVAPGQVIERGTVIMRDGVIVAVGAGVPVPADARVWEADSLTVYPSLIDAFVMPTEPAPAAPAQGGRRTVTPPSATRGAAHPLAVVRAETRISETQPLTKDQAEGLRAAGFAVAQVAPRAGVVRGQTAVVGLVEGDPNDIIVKADAAQ